MTGVTRLTVHLLKRSLLLLEQGHLFSRRRKYLAKLELMLAL